jgi:hypothetical protein
MGDVTEADDPAVLRDKVDGEDILLGPERARDTDEDLLVCTMPAGVTAFCACSAATSAERSIPRPASSFSENST